MIRNEDSDFIMRCPFSGRSASDRQLVADVVDAGCAPGGVHHGVTLGPGADGAGQRDAVLVDVDLDQAVIVDERIAVERVLDVRQDVDGFGRVADLDLLADAADADEARDGVLGFARCAPTLTWPVRVRMPLRAAASIPGGTVTDCARALFAAVVSIGSSR